MRTGQADPLPLLFNPNSIPKGPRHSILNPKGSTMAISQTDLEDKANEPKRVRTDEGSLEERSVEELIKADQFSNTKGAVTAVPWGLRIARSRPNGTVPGLQRRTF